MASIKPLQGLKYNLKLVDLDDVTTPPYDIIGANEQERYYELSPYNIIRLDLGKIYDSDDESDNRYTRAAADFTRWQSKDFLVRDEKPAIYVYRQTYDPGDIVSYPAGVKPAATLTAEEHRNNHVSVMGMICLVKLEDFGDSILPHEKTLAAPREDRQRLLQACRANFSQVFALYVDKSKVVKSVLEKVTVSRPTLATTDEKGTFHQVWPLTQTKDIDIIIRALSPSQLLIADGHHRYETSLNFAKAARAKGVGPKNYDYIMMYLVDMVSEDLTILPTHRLVKLDQFNLEDMLNKLPPEFKVTRHIEAGAVFQPPNNSGFVTFGLYAGGSFFKLEAKRDFLSNSIDNSHTLPWKLLDTSLLQETILGPILGITSGDIRLRFTQDANEAVRQVDVNTATLAVFLQPTNIDQITAVAEAGEKMPQKSTFFYPKPRTGLILNKLD